MNPYNSRPWIRCAKFGWNWHSGSLEEDKNFKRLHRDRQTVNRRQMTRKADLQTFQYYKFVYIQIEFIKFVAFSWRLIFWIISFKSSSGSSFVSGAKIIFCESLQRVPELAGNSTILLVKKFYSRSRPLQLLFSLMPALGCRPVFSPSSNIWHTKSLTFLVNRLLILSLFKAQPFTKLLWAFSKEPVKEVLVTFLLMLTHLLVQNILTWSVYFT